MNALARTAVGLLASVIAGMLLVGCAPPAVQAVPATGVRVPAIIGSNMVLQAGAPVPVWGWGGPGGGVTVTVPGQSKTAVVDPAGRWKVVLDRMPASDKPVKMIVKGANEIVIENVLVGEVWAGSGQSNMQWGVGGVTNAQAEIAAANRPTMRLFLIPNTVSGSPSDDVNAHWVECSPATVKDFSAALYFFGRNLQDELKTPVGLVASSWGGTLIEPWIPMSALESQAELKPLAEQAKALPSQAGPGHPLSNQAPTVLFNAMIHPIVPLAIRGAIWYQGESNVMQGDGLLYARKMLALIQGWRTAWGQGDFPFLFVQLAPWTGYREGELPKVWQAQIESLKIPNTGMAVVTDVTGDVNDIHPQDKQSVGKRLALWALAKTYGRTDLVYSGPLYKSMKVEGDKVIVSFDQVGKGLKSRDAKDLTEFQIAGENRKFVPAKAVIQGDTVVVSLDGVPNPVAVRFGWNKTANPNLCNSALLPASPFRTDNW
ncbi:MAG: sialate O-acetylesterase [Planctomycetota bacterium]|nr:sialate O-acetylesterase [Planctomycetota bacterium]